MSTNRGRRKKESFCGEKKTGPAKSARSETEGERRSQNEKQKKKDRTKSKKGSRHARRRSRHLWGREEAVCNGQRGKRTWKERKVRSPGDLGTARSVTHQVPVNREINRQAIISKSREKDAKK